MRQLWRALMLARESDRNAFGRRVCYVVLQSLLPLAGVWLLRVAVDSVAEGGSTMIQTIVAIVALYFAGRVVSALGGANGDVLRQRLADYMSDLVQRQASRLDMAYYDNPRYHDTLHRAQQEASYRPMQILDYAMSLGGATLSMVTVGAMLVAEARWWVVAAMVFAALPSFALRMYKARQVYGFRRENTQLYRRTGYYSALLARRESAAELRAYNAAGFLRTRFVEARRLLVARLLRLSRRISAIDVACAVAEAGAMLIVSLWMGISTAEGAMSIGTFVMLFEAFRRGQGYLGTMVAASAGLYDSRLFVSNLFEFLDLEPKIKETDEEVDFPSVVESVEWRDVWFRYPDMERDVLQGVCLTARRGEPTYIDGCNGYGKSTLLKLLLRLYDPDQGAVLVNGIDVRRFKIEELRRGVAVLFQDFGRYQLSVAENINMSDTEQDCHRAATMAGADTIIEALPKGYETQLGRHFDGGVELSMGQWQRVAMARALQSEAKVIALDEPTAWLDAEAKRAVEATIAQLARDRVVIVTEHR